jgi:hypothetical protein
MLVLTSDFAALMETVMPIFVDVVDQKKRIQVHRALVGCDQGLRVVHAGRGSHRLVAISICLIDLWPC